MVITALSPSPLPGGISMKILPGQLISGSIKVHLAVLICGDCLGTYVTSAVQIGSWNEMGRRENYHLNLSPAVLKYYAAQENDVGRAVRACVNLEPEINV